MMQNSNTDLIKITKEGKEEYIWKYYTCIVEPFDRRAFMRTAQ